IVDKIMKGTASAAAQQAPEGFAGYKASLTPRFDLEKAKQLMKEAGYPDGFSCSMIAPNNRYVKDEQIAQSVAAMLSKIGIKVNLKTMPKAQYWDQYDAQAGDIQMIGWHPDTEDSSNYTEFLLMCPNKETGYGQYNSGNYCNPKVDELIMEAMTETDLTKRSAMLQEVEQITYDDAAYIPMHWENLSWASKSNLMIETIVNIQNFPYFGDLVAQ
ncbi:MAG: ABC transporter substrate-binding protein, partial [Desulfoplanes sp.]|nr:ABC transporter substrate-binding protein [Desulfoplanes sp.]